jgi:glycogen synthase
VRRGPLPARPPLAAGRGRLRRVLMTADTYGGVWNYAIELAAGLGCLGINVDLVTFGRLPSEAQRSAADRIPRLRLHPHELRLEWMRDPWDDVERAGEVLLELAEETRPDLVHLNQLGFGALPFDAPKLVVGHSCVLSWWRAVRGEEAPDGWDRYRREVEAGLAAADLVVAPTTAMAGEMEVLYGPLGYVAVIPNAVDPSRFRPGRDERLVLAVGRLWDEAKNLTALDRVAPELPWPVALAGEHEHPDGGRAPDGACRRLGHLTPERLADWFTRASIYALPARYEPFGLTALEAALSGCALVLGDISSLRETWEGAAVFVDPDDAGALGAALRGLIDDPARRGELARRARCRGLTFTPQRQVARYLEAYTAMPGLAREVAAAGSRRAAAPMTGTAAVAAAGTRFFPGGDAA